MAEFPTDFPDTSFFAEHAVRTKAIRAGGHTMTVALDSTDYLEPFIDYTRLFGKIPERERLRLDDQWGAFCEATLGYRLPRWVWREVLNYKPSDGDDERYSHWFEWSIPASGTDEARTMWVPAEPVNVGGTPPKPWPEGTYSLLHGYNAGYEAWLASLSTEARAAEMAAVFDRFRAEYTLFVEGILHFPILWPNADAPSLVTPANWDAEGMTIADRYNHPVTAKEHWLLPIADMFAIYNLAKPVRYVHAEGGWLNYSGNEMAGDEGIRRPENPVVLYGGKPTTDPK